MWGFTVAYVQSFLNTERHIQIYKTRSEVLDFMFRSEEIQRLVKHLFEKGLSLLEHSFEHKADDRHALFRVSYTFYIRDLVLEIPLCSFSNLASKSKNKL